MSEQADPRAPEERPGPEPLAEGAALLASLRDVAARYADLFAAELRRAGLSLGLLLGVAVAMGVLAVTAWMLGCAALAALAVAAGQSPALALAAMALLNGLAAGGCWFVARALLRNLGFAATRRMMQPEPADDATDAPQPA